MCSLTEQLHRQTGFTDCHPGELSQRGAANPGVRAGNGGTIDLATPTLGGGSKSQVIVAGATASINSESSAEVVNDPRADTHSVMVKKGSGAVTLHGKTVPLEDYTNMVIFSQKSPDR